MKRGIIYITFLLVTAIFSQSYAATLFVGNDEYYITIQSALDDANDGDIIDIASGIYTENLIIDKQITLQGQGGNRLKTVIAPTNSGTSVLKITHGGLSESQRLTIKDVFVIGRYNLNASGIEFSGQDISHVSFENVISFYNQIHGLDLKANVMTDIDFSNCRFMTNQGNGLNCPEETAISNLSITDSVMNNNMSIGASLRGKMNILRISNSTFNYNRLNSETGKGLVIEDANDVSVDYCDFINNPVGIEVFAMNESINNVQIENSTIKYNNHGVVIWCDHGLVDGVKIKGSEISNSLNHGIYLSKWDTQSSGNINDITVEYTNIINNVQGIENELPVIVDAKNNWWGAVDGPSGEGSGSGDAVSVNVDFEPYLAADLTTNILKLNVQGDPVYVQPGQTVIIDMDALNLAQHVVGCQAVLNFDSDFFYAEAGDVDVQPGGGIWNELIWGQWSQSGDLDVAVGVDMHSAVGTKADGTVAKFILRAKDNQGDTQMVFRPDGDDISSTYFADLAAQRVDPGNKIASQSIIIDGSEPNVTGLLVEQDRDGEWVDVLNCVNTTLQGSVEISVDAEDELSGLAGNPQIEITGPEVLSAVLTNNTGTQYQWEVEIDDSTLNGLYTISITAEDKAGNEKLVTGQLCVNKTEIEGTVAMDTWTVASYSFNRDVVFKASDSEGLVLKEWTLPVTFVNGDSPIAQGSYNLKDVPESTSFLSAKTAWTLRRKVTVNLDSNMQGVADFTGSNDLLGGDLNGSNTTQLMDYIVLRNHWFTHNAIADINGDGNVQLSDYLILRQNWFLTGDNE